jgi:hypothetical protein
VCYPPIQAGVPILHETLFKGSRDGNCRTLSYSIGGPSGSILAPLLGGGQGLSGSHNKYAQGRTNPLVLRSCFDDKTDSKLMQVLPMEIIISSMAMST